MQYNTAKDDLGNCNGYSDSGTAFDVRYGWKLENTSNRGTHSGGGDSHTGAVLKVKAGTESER